MLHVVEVLTVHYKEPVLSSKTKNHTAVIVKDKCYLGKVFFFLWRGFLSSCIDGNVRDAVMESVLSSKKNESLSGELLRWRISCVV